MDGNPITKLFCEGCKEWDPIGFYTWDREAHPEKRLCKHLKDVIGFMELQIMQECKWNLSLKTL